MDGKDVIKIILYELEKRFKEIEHFNVFIAMIPATQEICLKVEYKEFPADTVVTVSKHRHKDAVGVTNGSLYYAETIAIEYETPGLIDEIMKIALSELEDKKCKVLTLKKCKILTLK